MAIVKIDPRAVVEAIGLLAEAIMYGKNNDYLNEDLTVKKSAYEQCLKLDGLKEIAEHSTVDFIEIPHETLILFAEYLPKTQPKKEK